MRIDTALSTVLAYNVLICGVRNDFVLPQLCPFRKSQEAHGTFSHNLFMLIHHVLLKGKGLSITLLTLVALVVELHLCLFIREALSPHVHLYVPVVFFLELEHFAAVSTLVNLLLPHHLFPLLLLTAVGRLPDALSVVFLDFLYVDVLCARGAEDERVFIVPRVLHVRDEVARKVRFVVALHAYPLALAMLHLKEMLESLQNEAFVSLHQRLPYRISN